MDLYDSFQGRLAERPLFSFLPEFGEILDQQSSARYHVFVMMPLIYNMMLQISALCCSLDFLLSTKRQYKEIVYILNGIFVVQDFNCLPSYYTRGLSVNPIFGQVCL